MASSTSVALLAEGVDRNHAIALVIVSTAVALLAEGVDRNAACACLWVWCLSVALLAEGVDRNLTSQGIHAIID